MSSRWHIAQLNVATARYSLEDPRMGGFVDRLDRVNTLADRSPGFVWRLQSESGNATDIDVGNDPNLIINMSVWSSVEALFDFVYKTAHREVLVQRRDWFQKPGRMYQVLWWVPAGHIPTPEEALERLEILNKEGPGPAAFNFKTKFPPPDSKGAPEDLKPEPFCSGWM